MSDNQPQGEELQNILHAIDKLDNELIQIQDSLSKEARKEKRRLDEEHENWAPLIVDARDRLGREEATIEEVHSLEKEENDARLSIRREFQQRAADLSTRKEGIQLELMRLNSLFSSSPSKILTEDALLEIFRLFVERGGSPWVLAHVCKRWRTIALQCRDLWSEICISTNIDPEIVRRYDGKEVCNSIPRLERALGRVGDAPFDLAIMLNWSHTSLDAETTEKMIIIISKHSKQWKTLHVENSEKVIQATHRFPPNLFENGLPLLRHVSFHMEHYNSIVPSLGLLPFASLLDAIEHTSTHLESVHFHGYGRNDPINRNYRTPIEITDLTLLPAEPRDIWKAYEEFLQVKKAITRVSLRYAPFIHRYKPFMRGGEYGDQRTSPILPANRRLAIYPSIAAGLHGSHIRDLQILDIVTHQGLNIVTHQGLNIYSGLTLPYVWQLSIYSNSMEGLNYLRVPELKNLRITLLSREDREIQESLVALQEMWDTRRPHLKELQLFGVGVDYHLLSAIASKCASLLKILFHEVTFVDGLGALHGLAESSDISDELKTVEVTYDNILGPKRLAKLGDELTRLVALRKIAGHALKYVTLNHGPEKEEFADNV
jgi:hypothetical protein